MENFFTHLTWLQSLGTAFGVAQVLLARNNNIHNYLFGIASILDWYLGTLPVKIVCEILYSTFTIWL